MVKAKNIYGGELCIIGYINIECSSDVLCVLQYGGTILLSQIAVIEKPEKEQEMFLYTILTEKIERI